MCFAVTSQWNVRNKFILFRQFFSLCVSHTPSCTSASFHSNQTLSFYGTSVHEWDVKLLIWFCFFFLIAVQTYYLFPSHFGELSVLRLIQYQWSSWRNWVLQAESIQSTPVFHCIFKTLIKKLLKKTPRISEMLYIFKQHCFADLTRTLPDIRTWLGETNYLLLWSLSE